MNSVGAGGGRGHELGDDPVSIGDEHGLARGCQPQILAQLVFQGLQPDGTHPAKVASRRYFVSMAVRIGIPRFG